MPEAKWIVRAALFAQEDCEPNPDLRGSEEYKRNLVRILTLRAVDQALERARAM
jgi:carbon-monoxide dehydrogenase medium subunit